MCYQSNIIVINFTLFDMYVICYDRFSDGKILKQIVKLMGILYFHIDSAD